MAWTKAPAKPDDLPGRPPGRVWRWSRSCGRFARSAQGSQDTPMRASAKPPLTGLIGDLRLKLARLRDQLLDRLFRRQNADEFALGIHLFHVLRQTRRIAKREFAHRGDAGGAHQPDLCLAHAGNPHGVGALGHVEQLLLADAGLRGKRFAALYGPGGLKQLVRGANAKRLQFRSGEGCQAINLGDWICHGTQYEKGALSALAEARGPCDDLAHLIRSDFVAAEPEKFTGDVLNLAHAH